VTPRQLELIGMWRALPVRDRVATLAWIHWRRQRAHAGQQVSEMMGYPTGGEPDLQAASSLAIAVLEALAEPAQ
jgi:hypothetical protein